MNKGLVRTGVAVLAVFCILAAGLWSTARGAVAYRPLTSQPVQITAETENVRYMAVSGNGELLVYDAVRDGMRDLWLRSADPARAVLPRRLTRDPARETMPVFSADNRYLAYVGDGYDIKGDIYLLSLGDPDQPPRRLTGRDYGEAAPCFSPDSRMLYFHRRIPGGQGDHLVRLDLSEKEASPEPVDVQGDGAFPAVSPDGSFLAFVSFRNDDAGNLFVYSFARKTVRQVTFIRGGVQAPSWSADSGSLYFSAYPYDTDGNGAINNRDNGVLFQVAVNGKTTLPYPLTTADNAALQPGCGAARLFFLTDIGGVYNCWYLPASGEIPLQASSQSQLALAEKIAARLPFDPYLAIIAYYQVLRWDDALQSARALYQAGRMLQRVEMEDNAREVFATLGKQYPTVQPEAILAEIELQVINGRQQLRQGGGEGARRQALDRLQEFSRNRDPQVSGRAIIAGSRLLVYENSDSQALLQAAEDLDAVDSAEALILKAEIVDRLGLTEQYSLYHRVVMDYPDAEPWVGIALERILDHAVGSEDDLLAKITVVQQIFQENEQTNFLLALAALNRMGDLYYQAGEAPRAKVFYREVLARGKQTRQHTAARLALAEILFAENRFRQALDLYETELQESAADDHIYQLARAGYIRKSIQAAEYMYSWGELSAARNKFSEILGYDDSVVEAHRGYIRCRAALGEADAVLAGYRARLREKPDDFLNLYLAGLSLTYKDDAASLEQAAQLLERAIDLYGGSEYFHQTLGYVYEVQETVHGRPGRLESALESYARAYFLNDPVLRPENRANLELNLGNVYFLLNRFGNSYVYYKKRLESGVEFTDPNSEILFYRRFGIAAFQAVQHPETIASFRKAIALIDGRLDPLAASLRLDKLQRYAMDQILSRAGKDAALRQEADLLGRRQADISRRLARISVAEIFPPPASQWQQYKKALQNLLDDQEALLPGLVDLAGRISSPDFSGDEQAQTLKKMILDCRAALAFPERFVQLKAEMLDRLGLALQEAGQWEEAATVFGRVFSLNKGLGLTGNLAANRRSQGYNLYLQAAGETGGKWRQLLEDSRQLFEETLELLTRYGVADPKKKDTAGGLLEFQFTVALDANATRAAHGFSLDQEKRLAETFLSRIAIELGELGTARKTIGDQLAAYPSGKEVADQDAYGVSLLYHRAGLIAAARLEHGQALGYFRRSAELAYRLGNPVSAAVNVTNMANQLGSIDKDLPDRLLFRQQLVDLGDRVSRLLAENNTAGALFAANYHNAMAVHGLAEFSVGDDVDGVVENCDILITAVGHLAQGITLLEAQLQGGKIRQNLALLATLHLNMARAALLLEDSAAVASHYRQGLEAARRGLRPDLEWRVLAGQGEYAAAFHSLKEVNFVLAGCRPREMTAAFTPLIADYIADGRVEEGFNLVEELAEIERFHRFAFLLQEMPVNWQRILQQSLPQLLRLHALRRKLAAAGTAEITALRDDLAQAREILTLMTSGGVMPPLFARLDGEFRESVMLLCGLALEINNLADRLVAVRETQTAESGELAVLAERYATLQQQYGEIAGSLREQSWFLAGDVRDPLGFFLPQPVTATQVMDVLPFDGTLIRLVKTGGAGYLQFSVSMDGVVAAQVGSLSELDLPTSGPMIIGYEQPGEIPVKVGRHFVLSGAHLVRSAANRKPYKKVVLANSAVLPEKMAAYDIVAAEPAENSTFDENLAAANILLVHDAAGLFPGVPTRAGDIAMDLPFVTTADDLRYRLDAVLPDAANLGLAVLFKAADPAFLGHYFSLIGCPTVIIVTGADGGDSEFSRSLLTAYTASSALEALGQTASSGTAYLLGDSGMDKRQAGNFARKHFMDYFQQGQQALAVHEHGRAFSWFEKCLLIVAESENHKQFEAELYQLATAAGFLARQYVKARQYGELYLQTAAGAAVSADRAEALLRLGMIYSRLELYDKAVAVMAEAIAILGDFDLTPQQIEGLHTLALTLEKSTRYDQALVSLQTAASLSRSLDEQGLLARQLMGIARIEELRLNQYENALQYYRQALAIYEQAGDSAAVARVHMQIGRCFRLLGNFVDAADSYGRSAEATGAGAGDDFRAELFIEQANLAWMEARYEEAFRLQQQSWRIAEEHGWPVMQTIALNTAGLLWWSLGNPQKGLAELHKGLRIARENQGRDDEIATTLHNIGLVLREMGNYQEALGYFNEALERDRKLKSSWAVAYDLRNTALTYMLMDRPDSAKMLFREAIEVAGAIGNRVNEAKGWLGLGQVCLRTADYVQASEAFEQAHPLATQIAMPETLWQALYGQARVALARGEKEHAKKLLFEAVGIIETIRSAMHVEQLKAGYISDKLSPYGMLIGLLADQGDGAGAFAVAERSRARNFIDILGNQEISLKNPREQQLFKRQRLLKARLKEYEALAVQAIDEKIQQAYRQKAAQLDAEYQELLLAMQLANPQLTSLVAVDPLTAAELQGRLDGETVLLSYYVLDQEVLCWVMRRDSLSLVRVPVGKESLQQAVFDYRRTIQNLAPTDDMSRKLYDLLIAPVAEHIRTAARIGIIPHSSLHYLSFATLFSGSEYLVEMAPLFYLPSGSVLEYTMQRRRAEKNLKVLAIGNPDLGDPVFDLPFAEYEVDSIKWNFPEITLLTNERATEGWVVANIGGFGVIHLASHGEFNPVNPLLSALKLSRDTLFDGDLEAGEIFGLKLQADMVVMSACQTGLGKITDGDDVIGLNRAFLYAGTHTLISSLWRVSDISTAMLVKQFYRSFVGNDKDQSLRAAMLHVMKQYPHPAYWGAFTLVGDYK